jgi:hypothetical protein
MYDTHFMFPEQRWGVFRDGAFVQDFDTYEQAQDAIQRINDSAIQQEETHE